VKHVLNLLKIPETRERILLTLWWLFVYRLGFHIQMPGVSHEFIKQQAQSGSTVFGMLSAFSGGSIGNTVIFGLGIMPYISASIIFSVLAKVSPQIEAIQKEGAAGQKKINQWTRLVTVPIALLQSTFIWFGVYTNLPGLLDGPPTFGLACAVVLALTAGSLFVMWLGELITEYGLGNGSSLIIMAGIIANMPGSLQQIMQQQEEPYNAILTLIGIWVTIVFVVVYVQKGERRVPIQYARLTRGRRVYGGQSHYLPLKINMAGVMPIIFASAIFIIPGVIFRVVGLERMAAVFNDTDGFVHVTLQVFLVLFFCFFWNNLMFRPEEIADNLREHGSFIPGIRPGAKTAAYLKNILTRITLAGAVFLAFLAVLPNFITGNIPGLSNRLAYFLGGTSVLIVVGVAMDLVDRLNAQLTMRNYEGFVKGKGTGGGGLAGGAGWARK
jgi:preprotein translocase subunit SecY